MKEEVLEIFNEIRLIHHQVDDLTERYHRLNRLLIRCVKQQTACLKVDFSHFSSRLHFLCNYCSHSVFPLEIFRSHVSEMQRGDNKLLAEHYPYDLKAVCEAIAAFYHTPLPNDIKTFIPTEWKFKKKERTKTENVKKIRLTISHWDERYLYGTSSLFPTIKTLKVCYTSDDAFKALNEQLYEGAQVNLIDTRMPSERDKDDVLYPKMVILEPDFLLDITSLCACIKPYGMSPYTYILNKFSPAVRSAAIQLGNAANQFLDDCVNKSTNEEKENEDELYLHSIKKSFQNSPLTYTTLPDIDKSFFERCRAQFHHIHKTVQDNFSTAEVDIDNSHVQLEPSFLCEALGIQGRMDLLTTDCKRLIELKSGKAEEYPYLHARKEHRLQMALYKEILYHNMNCQPNDVMSFLFYSHYPQFFAIDAINKEVCELMALRNAIIHLEHRLRNGEVSQVISELTEEQLNIEKRNDSFYYRYLRPDMMRILTPLHRMNALEQEYFYRYLTFMEQEQFLAKIGDHRPDSCNGFAETWNTDTRTKWENGNILFDLKITPVSDNQQNITHIRIALPDNDEQFLPNFRQGDMVMLYERNHETDNVTNKQVFRCLIEEIHPEEYLLRLSYRQRNADVFHTDRLYAIEPGYMDGAFHQAYSGLFNLLVAPKERKELLLGERIPRRNQEIRLNGSYIHPDIDRIVLEAKQAEDYYLLIGPPGTGKTSVALKSMVEEFLSDKSYHTILLMAYTNRAVDEICGMLSTIQTAPDYVRIGQELNCDPAYRKHLMGNVIGTATTRKEIYDRLKSVNIFVGTISSLCNHTELFELKPIDVAIIDEASQILEPQLLPLLCATTNANTGDYNLHECAIRKFILIGDHKQLPAVVMQSTEQSATDSPLLHQIGLTNCRNSMFERLHRLQSIQKTEGIVGMLHRQGRMHPSLSDYVNKNFYDSRLDIVPVAHQLAPMDYVTFPTDEWCQYIAKTRMGIIDVKDDAPVNSHNKNNKKEAKIVVQLVNTIYELYEMNGQTPDLARRIGIITPFRAQIAMIRNLLSESGLADTEYITIDTVERYQGSQRDIIIFSTTIQQYYQLALLSEPVITDQVCIDRKLNVAITRARKQFFLVGNATLLRKCQAYHDFIQYLTEGNHIFQA